MVSNILSNMLLQCGDVEQNPGPISLMLPSSLAKLSQLINSLPNGQPIYFYKNANGLLQGATTETSQITNNTGYAFTYPDGSIIYTIPPISSVLNIPWQYQLSSPLNDYTHLALYIDALESKSINATQQKVASKYTDTLLLENTLNYSFTYSNFAIDLSQQGSLQSQIAIEKTAYFKLGIVISLTVGTLSNHVIFQHNTFSIRLCSNVASDATTQYMIGIYDNNVFKRGVSLKPSDLTFKYYIYTDNTSALIVSGNTSNHYATVANTTGSSNVYIGQKSDGTSNSVIKLHDLLYYTSTSNDITLTSTDMYNYFQPLFTLTTYVDSHNVLPVEPITQPLFNSGYNNIGQTIDQGNKTVVRTSTVEWSNMYIGTDKFIYSTENQTKFLCIELLFSTNYVPVNSNFLSAGLVKSTDNGVHVDGDNGNLSNWWNNNINGAFYCMFHSFWGSGDYRNRIGTGGTQHLHAIGASLNLSNNFKLCISLNFNSSMIRTRIYNNIDVLLNDSGPLWNAGWTSYFIGGDKFYPFVSLYQNVGTMIKFNSTFTISGETNIMS